MSTSLAGVRSGASGWRVLPQADPAIRRWDQEWIVHHALSNHTFRLNAPAGALLAALGPAPRTVADLAAAIGAEPDEVDALLAELAVLELVERWPR
jgi:predicted Rossmann fold nucleotide-binding protein DprA/Smf involved in DNA uptake